MKKKVVKRVKRSDEPKGDFWGTVAKIAAALGGLASLFLMLFFVLLFLGVFPGPSPAGLQQGNVALLKIEGVILSSPDPFMGDIVTPKSIKAKLEEVKDAEVDALIVEINSPGGSPVATDEIATAIKKLDIPTVSVIKETGASGAYWIATSTDKIFANRMSVTGSIGVIGSGFGLEGLLDSYNITYRRLVAGKYKDAGTPWREMKDDEEMLIQKLLNDIHEIFIDEVAVNRNMSKEKVRELATGFIYLGQDAKELGLIDEIGDVETAKEYLESELNMTVDIAEFREPVSLINLFAGVMSENFYYMGQGLGDTFKIKERSLFSLT
ncbi:signal peptide peptidase SppA [Nanoarchaeota archaeon]